MTTPQRSESPQTSERSVALPARVVVTLRAGFVLALANIICVLVLSLTWAHVRTPSKTISVTGSAKKKIESDLIAWRATVSAKNSDLVQAYAELKTAAEKTTAYLQEHGVAAKDLTVLSITTERHYAVDDKGNNTDTVTSYELSQTFEVRSTAVLEVAKLAREITELIQQGILLESAAPEFIYTKLADLKVTMLAEATQDATRRAEEIAENSGAKLGKVCEARMGVMQVVPVNSTEVSDSGVNDTTSYEKDVMAVVRAEFDLE